VVGRLSTFPFNFQQKTMEREFHAWLKTQIRPNESIKIGIGDDAAVLAGLGNSGVVLASDAIAQGTHFDLAIHSLEQVGRKSIAVNLSDIAAMGATPVAALVNLMLPRGFTLRQAQEIFTGCQTLAHEFGFQIVGGDTNVYDGPLVISVAVVGHELFDDVKKPSWTLAGARPGDGIVVSGSFGGSIFGRHLTFVPRVNLAKYLIANYSVRAATDVSDSLSLDLAAMATASNVGAELDVAAIPISADAINGQNVTEVPRPGLQRALHDGEDFELILAVPPNQVAELMNDPECPAELSVIGRFTAAPDFLLVHSDGTSEPFVPTGYSH
jgi:thiamine-monophosphate kinase